MQVIAQLPSTPLCQTDTRVNFKSRLIETAARRASVKWQRTCAVDRRLSKQCSEVKCLAGLADGVRPGQAGRRSDGR